MTAYNTPPGVTVAEEAVSIGDPAVLVARPDAATSFMFWSPPGISEAVPGFSPPPTAPSTGQMWPRGGLIGAAGATGPTGPAGSGPTGPTGPNGLTVVSHGTNGATARPAGAVTVYWVGTATPANALPNDLWKDT